MENTFNEQVIAKWGEILDTKELAPITDSYRRNVTAVLLENQEKKLVESAPTNSMSGSSSDPTGGSIDTYDPVLISLVRRSTPQLIAFDIMGVQPMTMPSGLVFALRSRYRDQANSEALFNEANTGFSAENAGNTFNFDSQQSGTDPALTINSSNYTSVGGMTTAQMEILGDGVANNEFNEMAFSIEQVSVTAKGRALKASFTEELRQDLQAVHGLDAEAELSNILSTEITSAQNREFVRNINISATIGAQENVATSGTFDLDVDANGRWSVERFKGLLFQIERECNAIAIANRRGRGNIMIASPDLVSALAMTGLLDANPALSAQANLQMDPGVSTFAGILLGRIKVFIDPYFSTSNGTQYFTVGYKGQSPFDAGMFYCPYIPLMMYRTVSQDSFQPNIAFKTRYGLIANPFATSAADGVVAYNKKNSYYRRVIVTNLM